MKTTYNNVLSGLESADVVAVVALVHLPQDGNHASNETPLEGDRKHKCQLLRPQTDKAKIWVHVLWFFPPN